MNLIEAAGQGNITAVRDALEKGTDVNARDNNSFTALIYASINGIPTGMCLFRARRKEREK